VEEKALDGGRRDDMVLATKIRIDTKVSGSMPPRRQAS
jgi:hypothetical protein